MSSSVRAPAGGESAAAPPLPSSPGPFAARHLGPRPSDAAEMLRILGYPSLDALMDAVVPETIRLRRPLRLPAARTEQDALETLRGMAARNQVFRSYLGLGYHACIVPPVIQRNVFENPGWYTAYTPYQPEIAQGRLEALLNFQTMVSDFTGLPIANASLLDEATAAAEAMAMSVAAAPHHDDPVYLVDQRCHPQTIAVVSTRAAARGIKVTVGVPDEFPFGPGVIGCLLQYPDTFGAIHDFRPVVERAHAARGLVTVATDLLALALLTPPGAWGADIAVGNSQRFGVPLGYGGPHAAFFATRDAHKRLMPGRLIGVSRDTEGHPALRMALQTREQHIRREKATSNVCTAQVLLAVMASMYAVYHGPEGIRAIAERVHGHAARLAAALEALGLSLAHEQFFDTVAVDTDPALAAKIHTAARARQINLRAASPTRIAVALDETVTGADLDELVAVFAEASGKPVPNQGPDGPRVRIAAPFRRAEPYLTHPVFLRHRSETEMLRYIRRLEARDLSLTAAMIPLGSCTMKLNATAEMMPVSWRGFGAIHPFAPREQTDGYRELFADLETWLAEITGFARVSLQPNAGSQGEFAGLLVIRAWHRARGEGHRTVCLIPQSAHGTNPASAVMAGMKVVVVRTDPQGNIDLTDLAALAQAHAPNLAALMVTYPSTHGVFEGGIGDICEIVHRHGGQVYMDGANLNAQVGLCRPADIGADVCHLNLHKTFCIPHGGGGPGMGPIGVAAHLAPYLPGHPLVDSPATACGTISAAPWGSPSILPISWGYIAMMGPDGVTEATRYAILSANYVAKRLAGHYRTLYTGNRGLVAHECILDCRPFKASAGVEVEDVAKRLIDYGFHPPTVSFPVPGTLMVEPTESESKEEVDRFCEAMIAIREEIREIETGAAPRDDNLLQNAPHTLPQVAADQWRHPYPRERAGFPSAAVRDYKVWPTVSRIDGAYGDRNLVCVCPPVEDYEEA
ncbi:MAG TPA: aminomethyl-transferring glycine dehydrogenase [Gemmatimonadales bacterium]|nr:aminomethyl-transferring glycine dehydrogenase [Gemmatimonadales bacterium]